MITPSLLPIVHVGSSSYVPVIYRYADEEEGRRSYRPISESFDESESLNLLVEELGSTYLSDVVGFGDGPLQQLYDRIDSVALDEAFSWGKMRHAANHEIDDKLRNAFRAVALEKSIEYLLSGAVHAIAPGTLEVYADMHRVNLGDRFVMLEYTDDDLALRGMILEQRPGLREQVSASVSIESVLLGSTGEEKLRMGGGSR